MRAPFRIAGLSGVVAGAAELPVGGAIPSGEVAPYFERLMKLMPPEVIALYLAGAGMVPENHVDVLWGWSGFCLFCLVLIRRWGTADPPTGTPPEGWAVAIACVSFVIWLYAIGGPFKLYLGDSYLPWLGSLLVLGWTTIVPLVYRPAKQAG